MSDNTMIDFENRLKFINKNLLKNKTNLLLFQQREILLHNWSVTYYGKYQFHTSFFSTEMYIEMAKKKSFSCLL